MTALKLPTFLREYDKLARQCAAEGLAGYKLLIIDELGYVPLSQTGAELLSAGVSGVVWRERRLL